EAEAARTPRLAIHGDVHARDLPERLEQGAQVTLGRLEAQVAHEDVFHARSLARYRARAGAPLARSRNNTLPAPTDAGTPARRTPSPPPGPAPAGAQLHFITFTAEIAG